MKNIKLTEKVVKMQKKVLPAEKKPKKTQRKEVKKFFLIQIIFILKIRVFSFKIINKEVRKFLNKQKKFCTQHDHCYESKL